ncbi:MAG: Cytochrome b6 [Fimbriimonadaceae bacterium]|nr:Cytochrome b6 [Fimbriimonadaceae bacterium]
MVVLSALPIWSKYAPTVENAYLSTQNMRGAFLPDSVHALASGALILHGVIHLAACIWTGEYRNGPVLRWIGIVALWVLALAGQVTGTVLPLDRHDAQTLAIETAVAAQVPVVGNSVAKLMGGGSDFGQRSLDTWWVSHLVLGVIITVLAAVVLREVLRDGGRSARWTMVLGFGVLIGLGAVVAPPFGERAEATDFASYDARPAWYTWPLHSLLRMFSEVGVGWLGVAVVPVLLVAFVVLLPWINRNGSMAIDRLSLITLAMFFGVACLGFGGSFAPLTGSQDPPRAVGGGALATAPIDPVLAELGRKAFAEQGCSGCHGIDGSKSIAGPDLTGVHKKFPDREWYVNFIANPKSVRPNTIMPAFNKLDRPTLEALADYLRNPQR